VSQRLHGRGLTASSLFAETLERLRPLASEHAEPDGRMPELRAVSATKQTNVHNVTGISVLLMYLVHINNIGTTPLQSRAAGQYRLRCLVWDSGRPCPSRNAARKEAR
jgi:hypothetical protein